MIVSEQHCDKVVLLRRNRGAGHMDSFMTRYGLGGHNGTQLACIHWLQVPIPWQGRCSSLHLYTGIAGLCVDGTSHLSRRFICRDCGIVCGWHIPLIPAALTKYAGLHQETPFIWGCLGFFSCPGANMVRNQRTLLVGGGSSGAIC